MRDGGRTKRRVAQRQRASNRPLDAIPDGEGPRLVMDPAFRELQFQVLHGELVLAGRAHRAGTPWRVPFPPQGRSDSNPVALAFVGWARGAADHDMIASVLYQDEYPDADHALRERLLNRVKDALRRYDAWRAGRPFKAWMIRPMKSEK